MLLAVVSPEIRCEWRLDDWQVALVSTVSPEPCPVSHYTAASAVPCGAVLQSYFVLCPDGVSGLHAVWGSRRIPR